MENSAHRAADNPVGVHQDILKVARPIADLAGADRIAALHLLEAIQYRSLDRRLILLEAIDRAVKYRRVQIEARHQKIGWRINGLLHSIQKWA